MLCITIWPVAGAAHGVHGVPPTDLRRITSESELHAQQLARGGGPRASGLRWEQRRVCVQRDLLGRPEGQVTWVTDEARHACLGRAHPLTSLLRRRCLLAGTMKEQGARGLLPASFKPSAGVGHQLPTPETPMVDSAAAGVLVESAAGPGRAVSTCMTFHGGGGMMPARSPNLQRPSRSAFGCWSV
jgi:hypothetical protein